MSQIISVSCKLQVPEEIKDTTDLTLEKFASACNYILVVQQETKLKNTTQLHHLTYKPVRELTGLKANHVCQAIRRVMEAVKANKAHRFKPTSIRLDVRTFVYDEAKQRVGITLLDQRHWFKLGIGNYQRALLAGQKPTSATLTKRRNGQYYIHIAVTLDTPPTGKTPKVKVTGVDVGRRDIATTSQGKSWNGRKLQAKRARFARTRQSVQRKRTKSARRLLRRLSGRERRFQTWVNHHISQELVQEAVQDGCILAMEDLTGIRQRAKVRKEQRREHHGWAFLQLRLFVRYKAAIAGVGVVFVLPHYTSQTCHQCLYIGKRSGKWFECINPACGWQGDADINGACNIALLGAAYVNPLEGSNLFCSISHRLSVQGQSPVL